MSIEVKQLNWAQDQQALLTIEQAAFEPDMRSDALDLEEQANNGFGFVVYNEGRPAAYAIAIPLEQADYEGCLTDPNRSLGNSAYVESLAVVPSEPALILRRLTRNLSVTLRERNFQRVTMHVEERSPLHQTLVNLGAEEMNRFDNWQSWGKCFVYLEFQL